MLPFHAGHLRSQKLHEHKAGNRRTQDRSPEAFPGLARADARDHLVPSDQRSDGISAAVAEFGDQHEVKQVVTPREAGIKEEIDLLNEVQQPGHIHQPEERRRNGQHARGVAARKELAQAQAQHEENEEASLEIVDARRGASSPDLAGQIQERSHHQQDAAEYAPLFEADPAALGDQPVKLRQSDCRQQNHDQQEHVVRYQTVAGKHGRQDNRPQHHKAGQPTPKDFGL